MFASYIVDVRKSKPPLNVFGEQVMISLYLVSRSLFGFEASIAALKALLIMEYLVKISKKARILELKRRNMKKLILTSYTPYPSRKIRRICACTSLKTTKEQGSIRRESLSEVWTRFKDLLQKVHLHGIDLWLKVQIFYDHVNPVTRRTIDQSAGGKLHDRNAEESWALLEDLALYDNESWNDLRDFAKPVKAISLPQDVPSTSDRRLTELKNQVQRLMEAHLAPRQHV
ncbi:hypothetical protein Tco_0466304 [Tanacetum coccineum]